MQGIWNLKQIKAWVNEIDLIVETHILTDAEISSRRDWKHQICELEHNAKLDLQQKVKVKWISYGDKNTKFFHGMLKNKNRKNRILGININGVWSTDPKAIMKEVHDFFGGKFHESCSNIPKLISPLFKKLNTDQNTLLESHISIEEIKTAIWACESE